MDAYPFEMRAKKDTLVTGQTVQLKSGGPLMVVSDQERTDGMVCVEWFANNELHRDAFHPLCLVLS